MRRRNHIFINGGLLNEMVDLKRCLVQDDAQACFDFNALTGWSILSGTAVVDETIKYGANNTVKMTLANNTQAQIRRVAAFNMTNIKMLEVNIYTSNYTEQNLFYVYLSQGNYAKYFATSYIPYKNGWNRFYVKESNCTNFGGAVWGDSVDIVSIRIAQPVGGNSTSSFHIGDIKQHAQLQKPAILLFFDDAYANVLQNAYPKLQSKNIKATIFAIQDNIGSANFMTLANLQYLYSKGFDIGNHSKTHTNFTTLAQGQIETEVSSCKNYLISNNMPRAASDTAYPYGGYNSTVRLSMEAQNILSGRIASGGIGRIPPSDIYQLKVYLVDNTKTLDDIKAQIDSAIAKTDILPMLFHQIVEVDDETMKFSITKFNYVIDYIVEKQMQPLTISQFRTLIDFDGQADKLKV